MKKVCLVSVLLLCFTSFLFSNESNYFLLTEAGTSARMIRMGNVEGYSPLSNSVFENPAGLYRVYKFSSSLFTTKFMGEVTYQNLSVSFRLPRGMLGLGIMRMGVDDIPITESEESGGNLTNINRVGSYQHRNSLMKLAYQISMFEYLHLGLGMSYYNWKMHTVSGKGMNFDFGVIGGSDRLQGSLTFKNIVPSMRVKYSDSEIYAEEDMAELSSDGRTENLPFQAVLSGKYAYRPNIKLYAQFKSIKNQLKSAKSYGVEYSPRFLPALKLSAGYKLNPVVRFLEDTVKNDLEATRTMGVGIDVLGLSFDYAYESSHHISYNSKHYFSLGYSF